MSSIVALRTKDCHELDVRRLMRHAILPGRPQIDCGTFLGVRSERSSEEIEPVMSRILDLYGTAYGNLATQAIEQVRHDAWVPWPRLCVAMRIRLAYRGHAHSKPWVAPENQAVTQHWR
jgi:hypothetical protein